MTTEKSNAALSEETEVFVMPTKAVTNTYHFKKILQSKNPDGFAILTQAAEQYAHVSVEVTPIVREGSEEVVDYAIKRVSENHTLIVPDFQALLSSLGLDEEGNCVIEGTSAKEFAKVQESIEAQVEAFGRTLVDGSAETNEDGDFLKDAAGKFILSGFIVPTGENCTFAIVAAVEKARGGLGGKDTISKEVRDAAVVSLMEYLATVGVPAAGQELYGKLAKSYYSRNVAAALQVEAIKRTAERIGAWFAALDEDDKITFALFHSRLQAKALDVSTPKDIEMGIL